MKTIRYSHPYKICLKYLFIGTIAASLTACGNNGNQATAMEDSLAAMSDSGLASYYHPSLDGNKTASGSIFHNDELVAAHPDLALGSMVKVTNTENNQAVEVKIVDRGPTKVNRNEGVIIDLSKAAAQKLGMMEDGRVPVRVDLLSLGKDEVE